MIAADTPVNSAGLIRELAQNLERTLAGAAEGVCLIGRKAQRSCARYRDCAPHRPLSVYVRR